MKFHNKSLFVPVLVILLSMGCANYAHKTSEENKESKAISNAAALEAKAHDFVEIEFRQGSSELTDNAKASLNSVLEQARRSGKIDEVLVLSWSDEDYPSNISQQQPKQQRELAEKRNVSIKQYLKALRPVDVDTYNMAEKPNTLSKWFNTTDNKLKKSFLSAGLPTTADSPSYKSKASHSVILVKVE